MIFEGIAQEKMHFLLHGIKWLDEFFSSAVSLEIFNLEEIHLHMISSKYQCYMQTSDRLKFDMQLGSWSGGGDQNIPSNQTLPWKTFVIWFLLGETNF